MAGVAFNPVTRGVVFTTRYVTKPYANAAIDILLPDIDCVDAVNTPTQRPPPPAGTLRAPEPDAV
jgi:hypothetical protein